VRAGALPLLGSKSFFIASASKPPPFAHASLANVAHCSIDGA
jgi:hypothetical protein